MAIFNSYVKLPEGTSIWMPFEWWFLLGSGYWRTWAALLWKHRAARFAAAKWCARHGKAMCFHDAWFHPSLFPHDVTMMQAMSLAFICRWHSHLSLLFHIYIYIYIYISIYIYINIRNTFTIHIQLVGGLEHFIFSIIYGMSSCTLTNSYFSRWLSHHQPDIQYFIYFSQMVKTTTNHRYPIPMGSMVLVYMLTWLGYMDGIHGAPYIAAPWIRWGKMYHHIS